jgi:hypothetical protein
MARIPHSTTNNEVIIGFPEKLFIILDTEDREIIDWNSNGLSFKIIDETRFSKEVLPKFFHCKSTSV